VNRTFSSRFNDRSTIC